MPFIFMFEHRESVTRWFDLPLNVRHKVYRTARFHHARDELRKLPRWVVSPRACARCQEMNLTTLSLAKGKMVELDHDSYRSMVCYPCVTLKMYIRDETVQARIFSVMAEFYDPKGSVKRLAMTFMPSCPTCTTSLISR